MNKNKLIGATLIAIGLLVLVPSIYAIVTSLTIPANGQISMVKAFKESGAITEVQEFAFGNILPDSTTTQTFWLKNFGGGPVNMTLLTSNWASSGIPNPNVAKYMQVTWNREDDTIGSGMTLECAITLTVFANVTASGISTFSFNAVFNEAW